MKHKKWIATMGSVTLAMGVLAACGSGEPAKTATNGTSTAPKAEAPKVDTTPLDLSIVFKQVGDIPAKGNVIEQALEKGTNTKLNIQWVPASTYDEKINVMIAANELPKVLMVSYVPTVINAIQGGQFWEVGPLLKDYKNLSAQNPQYYENIKVDGKLYGIPQFREIARPAFIFRKDILDANGMKMPKTLDEWYEIAKNLRKNDTYAFMLDKKYNEGPSSLLTRFAVAQGGVNRWGADANGKLTPEFLTPQFMDVLKLFKRLYAEKLINQDFPALDGTELDKAFESGRSVLKLNGVATNAANIQDRLVKVVPTAQLDVIPMEGPQGFKVAAQNGYNGLLVFPKSTVKTEAELKRILTFMDKLLDADMSTLQKRGIEGVHFKKVENNLVEWVDLTAFNREVKPYRDSLLNFETYNVPQLKDTPLAMKGYKMEPDNLKYAVHNPTLTLSSQTYSERGKELDQMMWDAQTNYIVGKLDDAGFTAAIDKWRKAGGDNLIKEFEAAIAKNKAAK
ncbi:extracellular solute-binding protein [Paenibacillus radicis (ex Xue et al. 2023)]|uniref:Extracellular solute-binding protein n=1 Tax=Paenibacillus radicis (ex Xue et al. 2023) TaxID=2972489 RepID=A0ABT1YQJ9_9BACL|nr:extracellular solute-binding protein [Paenibacillus radicis (ex Xue et al. 2023)]MCR8635446.1 extracellular solute-binding protein [Paenibacillus radicis (ex Xue et al. 2023)]